MDFAAPLAQATSTTDIWMRERKSAALYRESIADTENQTRIEDDASDKSLIDAGWLASYNKFFGAATVFTQSVTFSAAPTESQLFSVGDLIFDELGITKLEEGFGVALITFSDESTRDAYLTKVNTWSLGGVDLGQFNWLTAEEPGWYLVSNDPGVSAAFIPDSTLDFVWT
tara:strand:+ start:248 stop:760 length:513 start_codon:yes stop_codon:yes gene_type:complete